MSSSFVYITFSAYGVATMREKLQQSSEKYHMHIHLFLGLFSALSAISFLHTEDFLPFILLGLAGNLLPDLDHILYFYTYGRNSEYSIEVRRLIRNGNLKMLSEFCKTNHKHNYSIYSHNLLSLIFVLFLSAIFISAGNAYLATLFLSWSTHYLYDVLEDILFYGKLNPNWFLKFSHPVVISYLHHDLQSNLPSPEMQGRS